MKAIHDFGGFSRELYTLRYDAPGFSDSLSQAVRSLIKSAGFPIAVDPSRGLDHGAWVPLLLMYPKADIPIAQLSLPAHWSPQQLVELGQAIAPLKSQNVLIVASGSATHNLRAFGGRSLNSPTPDWVSSFEQWLIDTVQSGDKQQLFQYQHAPNAKENHPSPEHLLPLFLAFGSGDKNPGELLHRSTTYGIFSMAAFRF